MSSRASAVLLLVWAVAGWGCDRSARESRPVVATDPANQIGGLVGPQPGPDQPVALVRNPYEGDPAARVEGRRLFNWYNCSGCHGGHGGGGMGPSLRDVSWIYGDEPGDIFGSIVQGRAHGMPAWGIKLQADHVWKLVSYIQSLQTSEEASPPPPLPKEPPRPPAREEDR